MFTSLASVILLSGCVSAPDLPPSPTLRTPATVEAQTSLAAKTHADWPAGNWWDAYGDPQLTALIEEGLAGSPDIDAASARFRRAAGLAQQAGAALLPSLGVNGGATLDKQSYVNGFPKEFVPQGWLDRGFVAAQASLDLDLWGGKRAARNAALSEVEAAALDRDRARLTLASGIADTYGALANLYAQRDVRAQDVTLLGETSKMVGDRVTHGLDTRGDLRQAQANELTSRAALTALDEEIGLRRNQLAALIGAGPDRGLAITRPAVPQSALQALPQDVTTELVVRRADVGAALLRVEAARSRIDTAKAAFYPAIRLDALIGVQSLGLDQLFKSDALYGSVGPAISLPIFQGGRLQGQYGVSRADYDEAVANYNASVLTAYREVADAMTSRRALDDRLAQSRAALAAAEDAYRIARLRYQGGLARYLDILPAQQRMLEARSALVDLETRAFTLDIALIRALGGGFAAPSSEDHRNG